MKQVVPIFFFSYFLLILASSRTDEVSKTENPNRERSFTETSSSFIRYQRSAMIPIMNGAKDTKNEKTTVSCSLNSYNGKMTSSSKGRNKGVSPIADPNFYKRYWNREHADEKFSATAEDKKDKDSDDSESSSDKKNANDDEKDGDDEMFFAMDGLDEENSKH